MNKNDALRLVKNLELKAQSRFFLKMKQPYTRLK